MKLRHSISLIAFWSLGANAAQLVDWSAIGYDVKIVGKLGVPLGEVVQIEAVIVAGRSLGEWSLQSSYLLRVESVGGKKLSKPPLTLFSSEYADLGLPSEPFALFEQKEGRKAGHLTPEQIQQIEQGYVGSRFQLLVFEEGHFDGYPPKDLPADFSFRPGIVEPGWVRTDPWPLFRPVVKVLRIIAPTQPPPPTRGP